MSGKVTPKRLPNPRTMLGWDGTDFFAVKVDGSGHLQIDVLSTVQDPLAPTFLRQGHVLAAVQYLYPLVTALESVSTDRLKVRGEDQLFSYKEAYHEQIRNLDAPAGDNDLLGSVVPEGEVWIVTAAFTIDWDTAITLMSLKTKLDGATVDITWLDSPGVRQPLEMKGTVTLEAGYRMVATLFGCSLHDKIYAGFHYNRMTKQA